LNEVLLYISVSITLVFAVVNGIHDGGNVVATIICSRSMPPKKALALATLAEFVGAAALGTAVAQTMAHSILKPDMLTQLSSTSTYVLVIGAVCGAIVWDLITWYLGLPSSSSHALIGGLIGAGVMSMGINSVATEAVLRSVALPLLISPLIGFVVGFLILSAIVSLFHGAPRSVGRVFTSLQKPSMLFLAASHGSNDAQKSMGIIMLVLAAGSDKIGGDAQVAQWVMLSCAAAVALGLSTGGFRIIKTVGYGIWRMEPVHSFGSQLAAALVILVASVTGGPVSSSQVVASSVMGVGSAHRVSAVRWSAAQSIAYAWLLTIPVSAIIGAGLCWCFRTLIAG
jgi:inorganic phosphate transporter, PiT family